MDFIFTGDADYGSERDMVASGIDLDCEVLSAGHHGSSSSSSSLFLEKTNPYYVVISCGKDNSYGHPHTETLERLREVGSKILITKDCGEVRLEEKES
jgi:beta-lactamase superfamily II metal-dependent hydrolase